MHDKHTREIFPPYVSCSFEWNDAKKSSGLERHRFFARKRSTYRLMLRTAMLDMPPSRQCPLQHFEQCLGRQDQDNCGIAPAYATPEQRSQVYAAVRQRYTQTWEVPNQVWANPSSSTDLLGV